MHSRIIFLQKDHPSCSFTNALLMLPSDIILVLLTHYIIRGIRYATSTVVWYTKMKFYHAEEINVYDLNALDRALDERIRQKNLPGVSVSIRGPEGVIFEKGYGFGDGEKTRPINENTVFGIASMSKSMTALSLCILAAEGRFDFDTPVIKFFPRFRVPGIPAETVTCRHLAMHTAGIPPMEPLEWSIAMNSVERRENSWSREMKRTSPNKMESIDEIIDYIASCKYKSLGQAGEYMSYSNEGYAILSYIVDQVSGSTLEEFLKERVFKPIGMTRSVLDLDGSEARLIASDGNMTSLFDTDDDGNLLADDNWSILPPFRGCACVKSTAHDMSRYYQCLSNGGVIDGVEAIPHKAVELMIGRSFGENEEPVYCYGLNKRTHLGHVFCEHAGGLHGVSTFGGLIKDENYGFAALCNKGDEDTDDLTWMMYNMVTGRPLDESHMWLHPKAEPFTDTDMVLGRFISHEGEPAIVRVYMKDGKLMAENRMGEAELVYCGDTWFQIKRDGEVAGRIRFYIRSGRAWAAKVYTRIYERMDD